MTRWKWTLFAALVVGIAIAAMVRPTSAGGQADGPEARLKALKIELPAVMKPKNTYVNAVRVGDMLYVSGTGPGPDGGKAITGRLGQDMDTAQGRAAARLVGLQMLAAMKEELGNLDKVERLVKTLGMVNCTADYKDQPLVINGFSDLMVEVFGDAKGKGARSAVGMVALPGNIPVEVEAIFQLKR